MKHKITPLVLGLSLLGVISTPVFAESSADIDARTQALEHQVTQLQQELVSLRKAVGTKKSSHTTDTNNKKPHHASSLQPVSAENEHGALPQISGPNSMPQNLTSATYLPIDLDVPGQSFVSSGPYLGIPLEYAGSNLIINSPSINEDVLLLKMRQNISQRLDALGGHHYEDHSHILLSGFVEGQAGYTAYSNKNQQNSSSSNIDLSAANFDTYILGPSPWTSGLMEFAYDNDLGTNEGSFFNKSRTQNSRLFISKAFIIIGNFAESPFYGSIGQMYVPFGVYSSTMVSSPLTKLLGRTNQRAINIGYQQQSENALYAAAYMFKGDAYGFSSNRINNGGLNIGYRMKTGALAEAFGAGVIGNIADSQLMQNTDNQASSLFGGFGATGMCTTVGGASVPCGNEKLVHRVPAYDLNGKFTIGNSIDVLMEYVTTSTNFNPKDMIINSHGAHPSAVHGEVAYSFQMFAHPTSLSAAYDASKDGLALGLPAKRYGVALNTSIWRNTLESIEVRHDIDYSGNVTSAGATATGPHGTGQSDNAVTAQIDLYF